VCGFVLIYSLATKQYHEAMHGASLRGSGTEIVYPPIRRVGPARFTKVAK
jgi:hypothetical protein